MCFSAEASFTSAVLLTVVGYATVTESSRKDLKALAIVPLLFALQQFGEGVLWLTIANGGNPAWLQEIFKWVFLFFAIVFWPVWMPVATIVAEKSPKRRRLMGIALLAGTLFVASQFIAIFMPGSSVEVNVVGSSIQYTPSFQYPDSVYIVLQWFYVFAAVSPFFFSSLRLMWVYAIANAATFTVAYLYYTQTFSSVWCFYAAVVSALLFLVIRRNREKSPHSI